MSWRWLMRPIAVSGFATLIAGACAADPSPPPKGAAFTVTSGDVIDLATEFLLTACRAAPGAEFANAWLDHEVRHADFYNAMYYATDETRMERAALAGELGARRDEVCGRVRSFLVVAPGAIDRIRSRVAALLHHVPQSPIYFSSALQSTDGRVEFVQGVRVLALNARHETFARTTGMAVTIAHELIHDAQTRAFGGEDEHLPPAARALFREGCATFGAELLFLEVGSRTLGMTPEQLERAQTLAPQAAGELLALLRAPQESPTLRRFFGGGYSDPVYPPKMGYYLGREVFRSLADRVGETAAVRTTPRVFLAAAESHLRGLSREHIDAPAPPVDLAAIERMRDDFLARARSAGLVLSFTPGIREWTRPSMISWRQESRVVAIPRWEELSEPQHRMLLRMADDEPAARDLFDLLFRWFLVAHELTHAVQDALAVGPPDHAASERLANDVALAFLHERPEARRPLFRLAATLMRAKAKLPSLAEFADETALDRFFDEHYDEIGRDGPRYGAFQVHFILDSFRRVDHIGFDQALERVVGKATPACRPASAEARRSVVDRRNPAAQGRPTEESAIE